MLQDLKSARANFSRPLGEKERTDASLRTQKGFAVGGLFTLDPDGLTQRGSAFFRRFDVTE
jgi:hypothetical protein